MNEPKIVSRLLFPTDQEPAGAVGPRMRGFDNPASSFVAGATATLLLATAADVRHVPETIRRSCRRFAKVSLVETQVLLAPTAGSSNRDGAKRVAQKTLVVSIGAVNRDAQRNAAGVGQDRSLDSELTSIGGVFPGFFPLPAAT